MNAIISERCDKMASKHDLLIDVDSEIAAVFASSKQISSKSPFHPRCAPNTRPTSLTLRFSVAQKGISANLLKVGSKRRRRKTEIEALEDQVQQNYREKLSQEVERQTKNLKNELAKQEAEARNNLKAAEILSGFIHQGDAAVDEMGNIILTPNRIRNEDSHSMM